MTDIVSWIATLATIGAALMTASNLGPRITGYGFIVFTVGALAWLALGLPYAKPTGYGLGKSGWVSFAPSEAEMPTLEQLKDWIDESYRAQAPKRRVKELDSR